jgi:hypothetical protein
MGMGRHGRDEGMGRDESLWLKRKRRGGGGEERVKALEFRVELNVKHQVPNTARRSCSV